MIFLHVRIQQHIVVKIHARSTKKKNWSATNTLATLSVGFKFSSGLENVSSILDNKKTSNEGLGDSYGSSF